jgi:hypothetical protein
MIILWILLGIISYIAGWFITARLGYYTVDNNLGSTDDAFFNCSLGWFFLIWIFVPWAFCKKFLKGKVRINRRSTSLQDFVCKGPRAHYQKKAGV